MKIQQSQNQTFQCKKRFLSANGLKNMQSVLSKMNANSCCQENGSEFSSKILSGLKINNSFFSDKRYLLSPQKNVSMFGESTLEFGKIKLTFDNQTGEIIKHKKPLFKSWKTVMQSAENILSVAKENFDDEKIVIKKFINISGFTQRASKKLLELSKKVGKVFLEPLNGVF